MIYNSRNPFPVWKSHVVGYRMRPSVSRDGKGAQVFASRAGLPCMEPPLVVWYDRRQWMRTVERPYTQRSRHDV
jgi:hypothetical protein